MANYVLIVVLLLSSFGPWHVAEAQEAGKIRGRGEYLCWLPQQSDEASNEPQGEPPVKAREGKIKREDDYLFLIPLKWDEALKEYREEQWHGDHRMMITKDGVPLESIEIRYRELDDEEFTFGHTKKRLVAGMEPMEMSEVVLDDMTADRGFMNFKVLENKPAEISGVSAFRAMFSFTDGKRIKYKSVYYGFIAKKSFFSIQFLAPSRHYFDKYLPIFEKVVQSFKLRG